MDSSAPTILLPRMCPKHTIYAFIFVVKFVLYLSCEKSKNKQKEAEFGPFKKITVPKCAIQLAWLLSHEALLIKTLILLLRIGHREDSK